MTTTDTRERRDSACLGCAPQRAAVGAPLLACHGLVVGFAGKPLLPAIDARFCRGELSAIVGRNGAGKTTFFRTLLGLIPVVGGELRRCTSPLTVGYIPQRSQLDPLVPLRAWDVVAMGVDRGRSILRPLLSRADRRLIDDALAELGAVELAPRSFGELSEGQKQRVLMARLVAGHPALAVLDEPTAAMDEVAERQTLELIDQLRRDHGMAVLIVSHHLPLIGRFADQVVFLDRDGGAVVVGPPQEVLQHRAFRARYGAAAEESGDRPPTDVSHA
jgi:zinc transport system ATP-binding protein